MSSCNRITWLDPFNDDVRRIAHCHDWLLTYTYLNHPDNCSMYRTTVSDYLRRVEQIDRILGWEDIESCQMRISRELDRMNYVVYSIMPQIRFAFDIEEYLEKIQKLDLCMEFLYESD